MRFSKVLVPFVIATLGAGPVSAQYRILHPPSGFGSSGSFGWRAPSYPSPNVYDRLAAFGRCTVQRDYPNSVALALAYHHRVEERDVVERMRPVLSACRRQTLAGRLAYTPEIRMAAIADALRERIKAAS